MITEVFFLCSYSAGSNATVCAWVASRRERLKMGIFIWGRFFALKPSRLFTAQQLTFLSAFTSTNVCIASIPLLFKTAKTKHGPTLKSSHQQLSSHLALSSHMLNEFILPIRPVVENSDANSYAMGLVATQRPETKCFHLERFCEWLCLLLPVGDRRPLLVRTVHLYSMEFYSKFSHTAKKKRFVLFIKADVIVAIYLDREKIYKELQRYFCCLKNGIGCF